jgi:hypothetical protein
MITSTVAATLNEFGAPKRQRATDYRRSGADVAHVCANLRNEAPSRRDTGAILALVCANLSLFGARVAPNGATLALIGATVALIGATVALIASKRRHSGARQNSLGGECI